MRRNWSMRGSLKWRTMMLRSRRARQVRRVALRVAGEDEIGGRGQDREAECQSSSAVSVSRVAMTARASARNASSSPCAATAPTIARRSSG
jgi:hypothetical protein